MITYVNNLNAAKYSALFDKATSALKAKGDIVGDNAITSLEEYFAYIKNLSTLDKKYTILPVDEELFEIDANSRVITVPASFKKNGIGVQGDEIAEIIYFKIDRFFDATDLNNMEIYIQWETAQDSRGVSDKGVSKEWVRDIESEPGKIIFGWPLSSTITGRPGTIKFSVRFYQWADENKTALSFSFSTLTAQANINPALDFPIDVAGGVTVDDVNNMIANRFVNSQIVGGTVAQAPVYITNLLNTVNLDLDGEYDLVVQAYSPDAGLISYEWTKIKGAALPTKISGTTTFALTKDTVRDPHKIYYTYQGNAYEIYAGTIDADSPTSVYERFASLVVNETGEYYATATNRAGLSTAMTDSIHCIVPGPQVLNISLNLNASAILTDDVVSLGVEATSDGTITYQWYKGNAAIEGATSPTYAAPDVGQYYVELTNTLNKDTLKKVSTSCRVTRPAAAPVILSPTTRQTFVLNQLTDQNKLTVILDEDAVPHDSYTYQWFNYEGTNPDDGPSAGDIAIGNATSSAFLPTTRDTYYVVVTNHLNGTQKTTVSPFYFVS